MRELTSGMIFLGECKPVMKEYLACLKKVKGENDMVCRLIAKEYLKCRMERYVFLSPSFYPVFSPSLAVFKSGKGNESENEG